MTPMSKVRWLACAYALALGYLLLAPEPLFFLGRTGAAIDDSVSFIVADWVEHGCAYAVLTGLFVVAFGTAQLTWPLLAALVHGFSTEVLQAWMPPREASWIDAGANVCGILVAIFAATIIRLRSFEQARATEGLLPE
jgi:VanZ family protein